MVRGRKPIAPEIHERNGSYVKNPQRKNHFAPQANGIEPRMPDYFDEDETLMRLQLCEDLTRSGLMSTDLREIMVAYCTAYGGWIKAKRAVAKSGMVLISKDKDGNAQAKRNPFSVELHKYREEMNRLMPEFGLTPASRSKMVALQPEEEDPFQMWLEKAGYSDN